MATSTNPTIQKLMNEAESLEATDENLEAKLQKIAEAVAAEQQKTRPRAAQVNDVDLVDPADNFACEGCQ